MLATVTIDSFSHYVVNLCSLCCLLSIFYKVWFLSGDVTHSTREKEGEVLKLDGEVGFMVIIDISTCFHDELTHYTD